MNTIYTLGIDIGSTTSKCAILKDGEELVATSLQRGGLGTGGPEEALAELWKNETFVCCWWECEIVQELQKNSLAGC